MVAPRTDCILSFDPAFALPAGAGEELALVIHSQGMCLRETAARERCKSCQEVGGATEPSESRSYKPLESPVRGPMRRSAQSTLTHYKAHHGESQIPDMRELCKPLGLLHEWVGL